MLVLLKHLRVRSPLHWRHLIRVALVVQVLIRRQGLGLWSQGVLLTHGRVGVGHIKIWIRSQCRPRNAARPTDRTLDAALVAGLIRGGRRRFVLVVVKRNVVSMIRIGEHQRHFGRE